MAAVIFELQKYLEDRGWSRRQLASRIGIRHSTINSICNNQALRLNVEDIAKICAELKVTPGDWIKYTDDEKS